MRLFGSHSPFEFVQLTLPLLPLTSSGSKRSAMATICPTSSITPLQAIRYFFLESAISPLRRSERLPPSLTLPTWRPSSSRPPNFRSRTCHLHLSPQYLIHSDVSP
jgi:hypothetical protein